MSQPRQNDEFVRMLAKHEPQIRSWVLLWVPNWNDAQDVTQQVILVLWNKFDQYRPGTNFLAWALTVAKLEAKKYWKRQCRERRLFSGELIDVIAEDAGAMVAELERRRSMLKYCLDLLKPGQRELLYQKYQPGQTVEFISASSGRSADAIYKSLVRVRATLLECVGRRIAIANRP